MTARSQTCSHDFIFTSAPAVFDVAGSSLGHGFPDFSDWCYARFSGTVHEMTAQQMHDYNLRALGKVGTAIFEALPAPKKRPDGVIAWHQKICACGYGRLLSEWVHQNCSDSVMTEDQRLLYNIQQLGAAGAIDFELQFQKMNARRTPEMIEERRRLKSEAQTQRNAANKLRIK